MWADRVEVESEGTWRTFSFATMGRPQSLLGHFFRPLGLRVGRYIIGARDCFHEPHEQFFRFDAAPPFTVFLPPHPDESFRELFVRVRDVIASSGRYTTDDLG